jgi:FAD-linked oxidoreductase
VQVALDRLPRRLDVDPATGRATVGAGWVLHDLGPALAAHGLAMANLGDIDVQTLAGALGTGTHGTGAAFGSLASQVVGLELVRADGELVTCSRDVDPDLFDAARVGLGAFGILTAVTLACVPAFALRARDEPVGLDELMVDLDEQVARTDHLELYWFPHTDRAQLKRHWRLPLDQASDRPLNRVRALVDDEVLSNGLFEVLNRVATRWPAAVPRMNQVSARALSPREYTDVSYRVLTAHRSVRFTESEWGLPRAALAPALAELRRWVDAAGERLPFPVEVRFSAAEDAWLAPAFERDTAWVAVHQYHRMDHARYFAAVWAIMREHGGRPHWGKLHDLAAGDLRARYPRFDDVLAVRSRVDPDGRWANDHLQAVLGSAAFVR